MFMSRKVGQNLMFTDFVTQWQIARVTIFIVSRRMG